MTRRFSSMLMAFLFPNKAQQNQEIQQANKSSTKRSTSTSFKRRTRSAEVSKRVYATFFCVYLKSCENNEINFLDTI